MVSDGVTLPVNVPKPIVAKNSMINEARIFKIKIFKFIAKFLETPKPTSSEAVKYPTPTLKSLEYMFHI